MGGPLCVHLIFAPNGRFVTRALRVIFGGRSKNPMVTLAHL
jgi:hypothetical protein